MTNTEIKDKGEKRVLYANILYPYCGIDLALLCT